MRTKATMITLSLIVAAAFISLMAWGLATKAPATGLSGVALAGRRAPDFILPLFDGGELTLSRSRGKPVVLNFWASWCVPCRVEAPILEKTWQVYKNKGVLFVGIDIQDREEDARSYLREFNISYPNGPDREGRITVDYGVSGIPVTFIVDGKGVIVRRWVGAVSEQQLKTWIDDVLAGAEPSGETEGENLSDFSPLKR